MLALRLIILSRLQVGMMSESYSILAGSGPQTPGLLSPMGLLALSPFVPCPPASSLLAPRPHPAARSLDRRPLFTPLSSKSMNA